MPDSHGETRKEGSGYYDIESPLPYMRNLTTQLYSAKRAKRAELTL